MKYKLNKDIIIKKRDNIYFGLNMETGTTLEMNQTQYEIIDFFSNGFRSSEELINYLSKIYDVDLDVLKRDVGISIDVLVAENILQQEN